MKLPSDISIDKGTANFSTRNISANNIVEIYQTYIIFLKKISELSVNVNNMKELLKKENYNYANENEFIIKVKNSYQYQLINDFKQTNIDILNLIDNISKFQAKNSFFLLILFRIEVNLNFLRMMNQNLEELSELINTEMFRLGSIEKKINYIDDLSQKFNNDYMTLSAIDSNDNANWILELENNLNLYYNNIISSKNNLIELYKLIKEVVEQNKDYQVRYNILQAKLKETYYQNIYIATKKLINAIEINITDIMSKFDKNLYSDNTIKYLGNISGLFGQYKEHDYIRLISKKVDFYLGQFNMHKKAYNDFFIEDKIFFGTKKHLGYFVIDNIKDILKVVFETHNQNFSIIELEEYKKKLPQFKSIFGAFLKQVEEIEKFVKEQQIWRNNLVSLNTKTQDHQKSKSTVDNIHKKAI